MRRPPDPLSQPQTDRDARDPSTMGRCVGMHGGCRRVPSGYAARLTTASVGEVAISRNLPAPHPAPPVDHVRPAPGVTRRDLLVASALWCCAGVVSGSTGWVPAARASEDTTPSAPADPWAALSLVGIDGKPFDTADLAGKVVLVVNVASFCSYTPQYADLQHLWDTYRERGLVVLGVPCNQFGGQEPGTDKQIRNFCQSRYGVDFPLLAKQDVNGPTRSPLYRWLMAGSEERHDVSWNFEKFVVNRRGEVVARFGSYVVPGDETVKRTVEMALDGAL